MILGQGDDPTEVTRTQLERGRQPRKTTPKDHPLITSPRVSQKNHSLILLNS